MHLVFVNDHDNQPRDSYSTFRNVRLCEGPCPSLLNATDQPKVVYIHNDHLGTPQMMSDENQSIVWAADYTPFGELVTGDENAETNQRVRVLEKVVNTFFCLDGGVHFMEPYPSEIA